MYDQNTLRKLNAAREAKEKQNAEDQKAVKKSIVDDFQFELKKGQAKYYSDLSLKRPLTSEEFARFKQLCQELGAVTA